MNNQGNIGMRKREKANKANKTQNGRRKNNLRESECEKESASRLGEGKKKEKKMKHGEVLIGKKRKN
ncbi:hypothetical protein RUM43_003524, partial [Polyplax serrata]